MRYFKLFLLLFPFLSVGQCVINPNNADTMYLGVDIYVVVKENKTWSAADACAATFGFQLAQIDSQMEQDSIYSFVTSLGIVTSNTVAPDGGGAAYLWLGGNDRATEGAWEWQTRQTSQPQFWQGARTGSPVNGAYNNWGNEPDNFQNQDALGLALTAWPFGVASQWNDVDESNSLYFIMEFNSGLGIEEEKLNSSLIVYPNPAQEYLNLSKMEGLKTNSLFQVFDLQGKKVLEYSNIKDKRIDISSLSTGMYVLSIDGKETVKFQKQ